MIQSSLRRSLLPIVVPVITWLTAGPQLRIVGNEQVIEQQQVTEHDSASDYRSTDSNQAPKALSEPLNLTEQSGVRDPLPRNAPNGVNRHSDDDQHLISQLDSPFFDQRRDAFCALLQQGTCENQMRSLQVRDAVQQGLKHPSIEVRLAAADLLKRFAFHRMERQLDQLRDPRVASGSIEIDAWKAFSSVGGEDMLARNFFARMYLQFPSLLCTPTAVFPRDPSRLRRNDSVAWAMLLWMSLDATTQQSGEQIQLAMSLSRPSFGPIIDLTPESVVLKRLVGSWIINTPTAVSPTVQKIRIALRYNQTNIAGALIERVFSDHQACAHSRMAALLAASVLDHRDTMRHATICLEDKRNVGGWTMVTSPNRRIRTEVRDVGLAVLLQSRGIDPRSVGFDSLEADPILVFSGRSLGFPDQTSRHAAHNRGRDLLQQIPITP